jgi:hypothetical protein
MDLPTLVVSRTYFDRMMAHHLALCVEKGEVPPLGLLQVAETIGGADWQPTRIDFTERLAELIGEIPKSMCQPSAVKVTLQECGALAYLGAAARGWFEDDPEVAEIVDKAGGRNKARLATYLLQSIIARRRAKWAELIVRTALWMREAPAQDRLCWRELSIVAKALYDGRDLTEIGLMRDVALRTIAVLGDALRI